MGMAAIHNNRGCASIREQYYQAAIDHLNRALSIATLSDEITQLPRGHGEPCHSPQTHRINSNPNHNELHQTPHYYPEDQFDEGMGSFAQPLVISEQRDNGEYRSSDEATILFNLGIAHSRTGQDSDALIYLQRSLNIQQSGAVAVAVVGGGEGPPLHAIHHNIGHSHLRRGNHTEAISSYRAALHVLSGDHVSADARPSLEISSTLNCIAVVRHRSGDRDTDQIHSILEYALVLRLDRPNTYLDRDAATIINNSGSLNLSRGSFSAALMLFRQAYGRRVAILGQDHIDVAASLRNIGAALEYLRQIPEAIDSYKRFISIATPKLGEGSWHILGTLLRIGQLCHQSLDLDQAHDYLSRALTSAELVSGPRGVVVARIMNQIGHVLSDQGKYDMALEAYRRGLALERDLYPRMHANIATTLFNIARITDRMERWDDSLEPYLEALKIMSHNRDWRSVAFILLKLGVVFAERGIPRGAARALGEAAVLLRALDVTAEQRYLLSSTLNALGLAQYNIGSYTLSLSSFLEALDIHLSSAESRAKTHAIIKVRMNAAKVYESIGETSKALEFYREVLRLRRKEHQRQREQVDNDDGQDGVTANVMHAKELAFLHQKIGLLLRRHGSLDEALRSLEDAAKLCEEDIDAIGRFRVYKIFRSLGDLHLEMGNTDRAMEAFVFAARAYDGASLTEMVISPYTLILFSNMNPHGAAAA